MTTVSLNMTRPVGKKAILARIASGTTASGKMDAYWHVVALAVMGHAKEHNDCSLAKDLLAGMPASYRRGMMKNWFTKYSPINVSLDGGKVSLRKEGGLQYNPFDLEGADAEPFYAIAEATPETETYDLQKILKLISQLRGRIEKKIEKNEVATDDIPLVQQIVGKLAGVKLDVKEPTNNNAPEAAVAAVEQLQEQAA